MYSREEEIRIADALEREGLTLPREAFIHPWAKLEIMQFVRNSEWCARCIPKECPFGGYQTTIRADGSNALVPCSRYKKYMAINGEMLLKAGSKIPPMYESMTFETLDTKGNEGTISYGKDIAHGASHRGLYLFGSPGCGKTHLAIATLQAWLGRGNGLFVTVPSLLESLKGTFGKGSKTEELKEKVMSVDLLVLDDIGTEAWTEWASTVMFELINDRYINKRKTIFTSNLDPNELAARIGPNGEKIVSRIFGMCYVRKMSGKDRRIDG